MRNVAILMGGDSSEYEISLKSAQVVYNHLDKTKYNPYLISVKGTDWTCNIDGNLYRVNRHDFSIETMHAKIQFDTAFIAIHGTPGENGPLQGYFDLLKIPYTTCGQFQAALTFNKAMCNTVLKQLGFACGKSVFVHQGKSYDAEAIANEIGFPCFVKPSEAGSSYGVSKVKTIEDLPKAIESAWEHSKVVIIESFLEGREITCGVHNFNGEPEALPLTEIITKNEFFDFQAKYQGASEEITPAQVDEETKLRIQNTAKDIFVALEMNAICRVDFMVNPNGTPYVIEINTVPGLSEESLIPQMAREAGYSLQEFFGMWVEHSLK